jgi:chemotaxis protein MotB
MNEAFNPEQGLGSDNENQPRPRKRRRKQAPHSGAWKVAYADFVTAMLALFIVLWVMGQNDRIKEAVQAYFRDPTGYSKEGGAPVSIGKGAAMTPTEGAIKEVIEKKLEEEMGKLQEALFSDDALKAFADQIVFQLTDEGIRMEFRDAKKFSFFSIGSAIVSPELMEILRVLTPEVARLEYPVVVEGHTDRRPYGSGRDYTNWELSADRANAVRRVMLADGLPLERISEVRAYADTRLILSSDPYAIENRRVSILLKSPLLAAGATQSATR